jgi:hypothetical protein
VRPSHTLEVTRPKVGHNPPAGPLFVGTSLPEPVGTVLSIASVSISGKQAKHNSAVITVDASASIVEPPSRLQFSTNEIVRSASHFKSEFSELNPIVGEKVTGEVRAPVKNFLKRVVVPILVERYIASLGRGGLVARTAEAL